jgi:hypothetical protein
MNVILLRSDNRHVSANHVAKNKNTSIFMSRDGSMVKNRIILFKISVKR